MTTVWTRLAAVRGGWRFSGRGSAAAFSAWTYTATVAVHVVVRRRKRETLQALLARGLSELERRLKHGMPVPTGVADKRLRQHAKDRYKQIRDGLDARVKH